MEKEFVPYELAVKLKQLGFDEPCFGIWKDGKLISVGGHWGAGITHSMFGFEGDRFAPDEYRAPTFSQAFRFFREKYDLHGAVRKRNGNGNIYFEQIFDEDVLQNGPFDTYEEAELACLDKLIEIVEERNNTELNNFIDE
jgi:hypothetical protein